MTEWGTSTIGDEFSVQLGKRVDTAVARGVPKVCINNRGVRWGYIDPSVAAVELLTDADIRDLRLMEGDLLVCEGGEIGRSSVWRGEVSEAYYLNTLHRLRSKQGYEPELAAALLEYFVATGALQAIVGKSSLAHLTKENLLRVPLPVPPPAEQKGISTALRSADDLKSSLERLIAKKRNVKQGMMQDLLTGRTRLPGFTDDWVVRSIEKFADVRAGGTPSTTVSRYWGGDIRWMSSGEIHQKQVSEVAGRITVDGLHESSAHLFPVGTVLMALAGQGKTRGTVAVTRVELTTNQSLAGIFPSGHHDPSFLYYNLDTRYDELRGESAGDGGRGGLNLTIIKNLDVRLPPIDEQRAIGRVLSDVDAEIETLKRRLESARAVKVGMMQELLTGRTRLAVKDDA
ncbi:restriction endonuclease subunit S [Kocuria arenosa]|uniref:restriction endonuclease subunit S n=1 Tax=Kocuria arenosa TaxID=3071446 RepID=UPI0034D62250